MGRIEFLRAPTSDVNVTIGLALVAFFIFEVEGFRRLGVGGYLGKFFPFYEFKKGVGAGLIALFVGLIELMLEFVKPLTLSMRLFGNIYGGEVALGVDDVAHARRSCRWRCSAWSSCSTSSRRSSSACSR